MLVQTDKGKLTATTKKGVTAFKGIPFAEPPVGPLRWKAPQPVAAWDGERDADNFGYSCIQPIYDSMDGAEAAGPQSEDCLFLNVWTTYANDKVAPRPVMVWLHGGAFKIGEGRSTMYDGEPLARKGAVVVTVNYRLGHLGFFAHPALENEFPKGPVNFGLLDQIAALEWVKRNIREFGGDPGNVTIFGESAGATSVLALFASPLASGLFHRGIAQSAYALPEHSRAKAVALGADVATRVFKLGDKPTIADLRAVPAAAFALKTIPSLDKKVPELVPSLAPVPVVGDDVLPIGIRDSFEAGRQKKLPLILGSNSDEQSVLMAFGLDPAKILALLTEHAGEGLVAQLRGWYAADPGMTGPELEDPSRFGGLILRDFLFTMQARWIAQRHVELGVDVRRYYFSYVPELLRPGQPHGVTHGGEIVFTFNTGDIAYSTSGKFTAKDRAMAENVADYWFSFARTGTPEGPTPWPKHEKGPLLLKDRILELGVTIAAHDDFLRTRLELYASKYAELVAAIGGIAG